MNVAAYALCLALSQEPEAAPAPAAGVAVATGEAAAAPAAPSLGRPKGAEEVSRLVARLSAMKPEERAATLEQLARQFGTMDTNPVLPTSDIDLEKYLGLDPAKQVEVVARGFFLDLVGGDAARLVARAGYPFYLEGKRIDRAEELKTQWGLSLRSRRADLLKLYGVEVLLPAEMEKKHGKPPQRLSGWSWRGPNTYVAVGNLSGHPAVLLLRQAGAAWQVVGFHD
jgi:hypothetical protein